MSCLRLLSCVAMVLFAGQSVFAAEPVFVRLAGGTHRFQAQLPAGSEFSDPLKVTATEGGIVYPSNKLQVHEQAPDGLKVYNVIFLPKEGQSSVSRGPFSVRIYYRLNNETIESSASISFDQNGIVQLPKSGGGNFLPDAAPTAASVTSDAARQRLYNGLIDAVIDLATKAKVPGVAYYDHEPRLSCRTLAKIFGEIAESLKTMPEELTAANDEALMNSLRLKLAEFYGSRERLETDWKPYLEKVQEMIRARQDSNDPNIALDLTSRADVDLVFRALQAAFLQMEKMHRDYAPPFYSPELLRQFESGSYGGNFSRGGQYGTTGSGSAACAHCRKGHRHCRCARLLFR